MDGRYRPLYKTESQPGLFVDLRGYELVVANRVQPGQVFATVLRVLGVPAEGIPSDAAQQPAAYHGHLDALAAQDERVLVVLDNAADPDQVRDLLPIPMAARARCALGTHPPIGRTLRHVPGPGGRRRRTAHLAAQSR